MRFAVLVSTLAAFAAAAPAATRQEGKRGQLVDALATATDAVDDATNALGKLAAWRASRVAGPPVPGPQAILTAGHD